mmetsp:Transcript_19778/g.19886  ORF Transcript_19778/g.19886 Transcript_19778/m.19886 type:complete len:199 (+) Transcript_19778:79-675(+)
MKSGKGTAFTHPNSFCEVARLRERRPELCSKYDGVSSSRNRRVYCSKMHSAGSQLEVSVEQIVLQNEHISDERKVNEISNTKDFVDAMGSLEDDIAVVMFYSPACRSCKAIHPHLDKLAKDPKYEKAKFYRINASVNEGLCKQLEIENIPTFHFYTMQENQLGKLTEFSCGGFECLRRLRSRLDRYGTNDFRLEDFTF